MCGSSRDGSSGWTGDRSRPPPPPQPGPSPLIRFLALARMQLLEEYHSLRADKLSNSIADEGMMRNPIIVAPVGDRYVVLDGHHRFECLRKCCCTHALVQVVPLHDIRVEAWCHLGRVEVVEDFEKELVRYEELSVADIGFAEAEEAVAGGRVLGWFAVMEALSPRVRTLEHGGSLAPSLSRFSGLYNPEKRDTPKDLLGSPPLEPAEVFRRHGKFNLLVRFARLDTADLEALVRAQDLIPSGVTRVVLLGGRALGLNVPLELLGSELSDDDRDHWLADRLQGYCCYVRGPVILEESETRSYDEDLWLFDPDLKPRPC